MSLRIIATGGTFDKHYDELTGTLGFADSHLPAVLARTRMTISVALEQLPLLDSLDMKDADRQRVLAACRLSTEPTRCAKPQACWAKPHWTRRSC
jgi:L-asparaginase